MEQRTNAAGPAVPGLALAHIIRGMSVALLGSLLGGGLGFVFSVVMARLLPQADFGLLVLALTFLTSAAALGVAGADYATIRYVAAARTPGGKRGAMVTPFVLVVGLNVLVAILLVALARPIAVDLLGQPHFTNVLRALALAVPLTVAAQMFSACLSGLEQASGELARKVSEQTGRIVFGPVALAVGLGLVGVVLGLAAAGALAAAAVGFLLLRTLPTGGPTEPIRARDVVGFAWPQTAANVAKNAWTFTLILILARSTDARTVALYGAALFMAGLPGLVYNAFSFRFSPTIARLWARGEHEELRELLQGVTRWVAIAAVPLFAVAITLAGPLLEVYGEKYREGATALSLVAAAALLNSLSGPVERALIMTGRVKLEMAANLATTAGMIAVAVVLVPRVGIVGAALAELVYAVVMNGLKSYFVWRTMRMYAVSPALVGPLVAAVLASIVVAAVERTTTLGLSLPGTALLAVCLLAVYALVLARVIGIPTADRAALRLALRSAR